MTSKEAYQILGLPPGSTLRDVKRKYRNLMMKVHPDVNAQAYCYSAQEINTAYSVLKEKLSSQEKSAADTTRKASYSPKASREKQVTVWNAPVNGNAYREREVLQYVEDHEGTVIGHFCIAKGKYMWTTDEDFSLFLLSLYQCSKQILDEIDTRLDREVSSQDRQQFQAELTYLLAQQFISQTALLREIAKEEQADTEGNPVFYISSMLESSDKNLSLKPGEYLYPSRIRHHRLYLKSHDGKETGYLSFSDDRLYYIVVPFLEQKAVQIKIQAAEKQPEKRSRAHYQNLHLWIKLIDEKTKKLPENLNLQIEQLLKKFSTI